jgi:hypothetical protein
MSFAAPAKPILGDREVRRRLAQQEERGKDPDVNRILVKHLRSGGGLTGKVVNRYNKGDYLVGGDSFANALRNTRSSKVLNDLQRDDFDDRFGAGASANIAGLEGAKIAKGNVYMGATEVEVPGYSANSPLGGHTSTPGYSRYDITTLPRWMVKQAAPQAGGDDEAKQTTSTTVEPSADLQAARQAYDRANAYQAGSGSANSGGAGGSFASSVDFTKTGGDLLNAIAASGAKELDDYQNRFIPRLTSSANLAAQEIGYGARSAINALPDDLKLPDYSKIFPDRAEKKGGLYKWLEGRIA